MCLIIKKRATEKNVSHDTPWQKIQNYLSRVAKLAIFCVHFPFNILLVWVTCEWPPKYFIDYVVTALLVTNWPMAINIFEIKYNWDQLLL